MRTSVFACALGLLAGCAAFQRVTPADRQTAYEVEAAAMAATCKAYRFDRAAGLVPEVPSMSERCP